MAFGAFERLMASRYLRARRQEGFISVNAWFSIISIGLGVAALIIVMSVMNGFRAELAARIQGINAHVSIAPDPPGTIADPAQAVAALRAIAGVANVSPVVDRQVMGAANGVAVGARVLGLPPEDLRARPLIAGTVIRGNLDAFQGDDAIVIGARMAERLGLDIGAQINLIAPQAPQGNLLVAPRTRTYQVVAIFQTSMFEVDNTNAFLPLDAAAAFFAVDGATAIELMLADPDRVNTLRPALQAAAPGLRVTDWQERNSTLFNALLVEKNVMFVILTMVVLVAAFNIVATLIMLVAEKGRGIAILRTMGAAQGAVSRIFFMIGAAIGVLGTLGGLAIGVGFTANIERVRGFLQSLFAGDEVPAEVAFLLRLPARMDEREIVIVAIIALVLAVIAAIYPSWRASRLDPVEALRYE
jgi:lipoprotein-releasing system permease protein